MPNSILILGPVPPPYGGVSTHVVRSRELFESHGCAVTMCRYTGIVAKTGSSRALSAAGMIPAIYRRVFERGHDVMHIHYGGMGYFLAILPAVRLSRSRRVLTLHSVRILQDLEKSSASVRATVRRELQRFDLLIPVSEEIADGLRSLGIDRPEVFVMPAFLPPSSEESSLGRLPTRIRDELDAGLDAGRHQVCIAAYSLGPGYGHEDLYGVEALVRAVRGMDIRAELDLWVMVSNEPSNPEQDRSAARIGRMAQEAQVRLHLHYGQPLLPVLSRSSVFVRPSRQDGDSVAVREALMLGIPVLASSVVSRPAGTVLLPSLEPESLGPTLARVLTEEPSTDTSPPPSTQTGRFDEFVSRVLG